MVWQDLVITFAQGALGLTLLPTLLDEDASVPRYTSVPMAFFLYIIGAAFVTLELWFSAGTTAFVASMWVLVVLIRP